MNCFFSSSLINCSPRFQPILSADSYSHILGVSNNSRALPETNKKTYQFYILVEYQTYISIFALSRYLEIFPYTIGYIYMCIMHK